MIPTQELLEHWRAEMNELYRDAENEGGDPEGSLVLAQLYQDQASALRVRVDQLEAALAAGDARAPQWQPAFERFMREFAEWKDDDQAGYDDLLNISDRFYEAAAASGAGPSPPHEA